MGTFFVKIFQNFIFCYYAQKLNTVFVEFYIKKKRDSQGISHDKKYYFIR